MKKCCEECRLKKNLNTFLKSSSRPFLDKKFLSSARILRNATVFDIEQVLEEEKKLKLNGDNWKCFFLSFFSRVDFTQMLSVNEIIFPMKPSGMDLTATKNLVCGLICVCLCRETMICFTCSECRAGSLPSLPGAFCSCLVRSITRLQIADIITTPKFKAHIKYLRFQTNHKKEKKS